MVNLKAANALGLSIPQSLLVLTLVCVLAARPQLAAGQGTRLPRVVMIVSVDEQGGGPFIESFRKEAGQIEGQTEGQTLVLELRYGNLESARIDALHREAVAERPDVRRQPKRSGSSFLSRCFSAPTR